MVIFICIVYFSILVACYKLATIVINKFCITKNKFCFTVFQVKMILFLISCTLKRFKGIWDNCLHVRTSQKGNYRLLFLIHKQNITPNHFTKIALKRELYSFLIWYDIAISWWNFKEIIIFSLRATYKQTTTSS